MIKIYNNIEIEVNEEDLNKKGVIYKLIFPNNKIYIGQTTRTLKERLIAHCSYANTSNSKSVFKNNAIKKYRTFKVEILYQGDKIYLNTLEKFYIAKYESTNREFGYNLSAGGDGMSGKLNSRAKSIIVIDLITKEEKVFDTIRLAADYYQIGYTSISDVLSGRRKTFKNKQYFAKLNN